MDLSLHDVARLLALPEQGVLRLTRDKQLPAYRIHRQYRFDRAELNAWMLDHRVELTDRAVRLVSGRVPVDLVALLKRGGVHRDVEGDSVAEVLAAAVERLALPPGHTAKRVSARLVEREGELSTAVGNGIAMPHSRLPILTEVQHELAAVCYPSHPVDFRAPDGIPVGVLFILLTANPKRHLELLSKLARLCAQPEFRALLAGQASLDELASSAGRLAAGWELTA